MTIEGDMGEPRKEDLLAKVYSCNKLIQYYNSYHT